MKIDHALSEGKGIIFVVMHVFRAQRDTLRGFGKDVLIGTIEEGDEASLAVESQGTKLCCSAH